MKLCEKAARLGLPFAGFREPDRDNELTAVAFGPACRKVVSHLPLALRGVLGSMDVWWSITVDGIRYRYAAEGAKQIRVWSVAHPKNYLTGVFGPSKRPLGPSPTLISRLIRLALNLGWAPGAMSHMVLTQSHTDSLFS